MNIEFTLIEALGITVLSILVTTLLVSGYLNAKHKAAKEAVIGMYETLRHENTIVRSELSMLDPYRNYPKASMRLVQSVQNSISIFEEIAENIDCNEHQGILSQIEFLKATVLRYNLEKQPI